MQIVISGLDCVFSPVANGMIFTYIILVYQSQSSRLCFSRLDDSNAQKRNQQTHSKHTDSHIAFPSTSLDDVNCKFDDMIHFIFRH